MKTIREPFPAQSRRYARLLAACLAVLAAGVSTAGRAAESCPGGKDLVLTNGTILTVDGADRTVGTVRIRGRRFLTVGEPVDRKEPCVDVVDLGGRTVIPGLIDNHTHFVRTAQAPGPFVAGLESAASIKDLMDAFAAAARKAEPGEWVTAIGGFTPLQFAEKRLPTRAELTAAVPDHPVYLQVGYSTRGVVNDEGRRVLQAAGIPTSDAGDVKPDGDGLTFVLRSASIERMQRRFPDYMNYAVSLGLTTVVDQACCDWLGAHLTTADRPNLKVAEYFWRAGRLPLRLRIQYDHRDTRDQSNIRSATARIENATQGLGDEMYKAVRFGEQVIAGGATDQEVEEVYQRIADAGWALSQHTIREEEIERYLRIMERVAAKTPIANLRWTLEHVFEITPSQIERLKKIGVGVRAQDHDYIRNQYSSWKAGPPFRTLLESGIRLGAGTDGGVVGPLNPWLCIYFMITGKDAGGELLLPGQQIGRKDALRLYTAANAWFNFEENDLGSIEAGKLADLVVLDKPYLTASDDEIRKMQPVLTLVGGRVVHARAPFAGLAR
ncbi:MAG TPA: amidohydrolase family protein [Gammaproteobacteria bacterium]|nr:amidohydrolase family protein [Gammaproteobacteria bacterium]